MHSEIIVCTRNRTDDVARLLQNLLGQEVRPRLIVVDSSDDASSEHSVRAFASASGWPGVEYVKSEPGLTRQRMAGIAHLSSDCRIVHFIDDDVLLEPDYFSAIESCFASSPDIVGVGGVVTNTMRHRPPHLLNRLFLLDSRRQGVVLRSGVNIRCFEALERTEVQWLSGCSMSYRRDVFSSCSFDTDLEGYSLGEDVDFSFGVSRLGRLVVCPQARLQHLEKGVTLSVRRTIWRDEVVRRFRFVKRYRGMGMSLAAFWWSVFGDIILTLGKALAFGDRREQRHKIRGLIDGLGAIVFGRVSSS